MTSGLCEPRFVSDNQAVSKPMVSPLTRNIVLTALLPRLFSSELVLVLSTLEGPSPEFGSSKPLNRTPHPHKYLQS